MFELQESGAVRIPASSADNNYLPTGWGGQVKVRDGNGGTRCWTTFVTPCSTLVRPTLVPLVRPSSPFCVRVANLTNDDLWIQPRTRIGVLHAVGNIESGVEFKRVSVNEEIVTVQSIESTPIPDVAENTEHPCTGLSPEHARKAGCTVEQACFRIFEVRRRHWLHGGGKTHN